jgi:hypothetical protein
MVIYDEQNGHLLSRTVFSEGDLHKTGFMILEAPDSKVMFRLFSGSGAGILNDNRFKHSRNFT